MSPADRLFQYLDRPAVMTPAAQGSDVAAAQGSREAPLPLASR
jgi:hypothetical protein